jgi:uncharacterized repeat protein (TIGR01451 family)
MENSKNNNTPDKDINEVSGKVKINNANSGLAQFTKRAVPNEKQLEEFEEYISDEAKEEEIDESLSEIYQDDKGRIVDVKRMDIKKGRGFIFWFIFMLFIFGSLAAAGYAGYSYYLRLGSDATAMEFKMDGPTEAVAGEELVYTLDYINNSKVNVNDSRVEVVYPENFIYIESTPAPSEKNNIWQINSLAADQTGQIKIKGKIFNLAESNNVVLSSLTYMPANFSSEFKKEATITTYIKDVGLDFDFDFTPSTLVGDENEINFKYSAKAKNFINQFRLTVVPQENLEFAKDNAPGNGATTSPFTLIRPGTWQINTVKSDEQVLPIKFKFNKKISDTEEVAILIEKSEGDKFYKFIEKKLKYEVMKNDLNLTLIINGSRDDQAVDFGQTLNYSIVYKNKGETEMKDVIIMAVLQSDFISWTSLSDKQNGKVKSNTISWSKEEILELSAIAKNQEGTIDFSIKIMEMGVADPTKDYQVKSFAQFAVGTKSEVKESVDNRSNTIINRIKSDLKLNEEVRYFSEDNIPVGTGPNPPKVGEPTSYKVYWKLSNNLHELNDLEIRLKLPDYAGFDGKNQATVGNINFNSDTREVVWQIGRLPVTTFDPSAEFNVSITPTEADRNKIMVILPGSRATALDTVSNTSLEYTSKAKTTKLEDDEIGANDGMVQ